MIEAALFASTFSVVFALGFQQQNVTGGHYLAAFLTSFWIGASYLALYRYMPDPTWPQVLAYLAGGPFGIVSSMWVHKRTVGRKQRDNVAQIMRATFGDDWRERVRTGPSGAPTNKPPFCE